MDASTGRIVAATLTDRAVDDAAQVGPLLDQMADPVTAFSGDGAYDRNGVYAAMQARHPEAAVVVPPRIDAVLSNSAETAPTPRDRHLQQIAKTGRLKWQRNSQYNLRALVEAQSGRFKQV